MTNYRKRKRFNNKINRPLKSLNRFAKKSIQIQKKGTRIRETISMSRTLPIDQMNGEQFEYFLADLYIKLGYKTQITSNSGDYGADLIVKSDTGEQKIIQAKRYSQKVGVRAVQEISSAKGYYRIYNAIVITNNYFTEPAKNLAMSNNVELVDRDDLMRLISQTERIEKSLPNKKRGFFANLFNI